MTSILFTFFLTDLVFPLDDFGSSFLFCFLVAFFESFCESSEFSADSESDFDTDTVFFGLAAFEGELRLELIREGVLALLAGPPFCFPFGTDFLL